MQPRDRNAGHKRRRAAFVVEDDVQTMSLLRDLAESAGLEVVGFTRVAAARRAIRHEIPAVMVVDDDLPDGRGADLARELRSNPRTRDVPVLICTAADSERRRAIADAAPIIRKPFVLGEIERVFERVAG